MPSEKRGSTDGLLAKFSQTRLKCIKSETARGFKAFLLCLAPNGIFSSSIQKIMTFPHHSLDPVPQNPMGGSIMAWCDVPFDQPMLNHEFHMQPDFLLSTSGHIKLDCLPGLCGFYLEKNLTDKVHVSFHEQFQLILGWWSLAVPSDTL